VGTAASPGLRLSDSLPAKSDQDAAIARALASGSNPERVREAFGVDLDSLSRPELQALVDDTKAKLQFAQQQMHVHMQTLVPKALANVERMLDDDRHREHGSTSRWVLESVRPAGDSTVTGMRLDASPEAVKQIAETLRDLAKNRSRQPETVSLDHDPNLVDR
jgi:hypothetical protein